MSKLTQEKANQKWQATKQLLKIKDEDCYTGEDGIDRLKGIGVVKSNLLVAVHYLKLLDQRDEDYTTPFDKDKFTWLLREPVGKSKIDESRSIMKECAAMTRKRVS